MLPSGNPTLGEFLKAWVHFKNNVAGGEASLQLSINTTDEAHRVEMFGGMALSLEGVSRVMKGLVPKGRKFTLNFALGDWPINPETLLEHFNPEYYICKLTPLYRTRSATSKGMVPPGEWTERTPYLETEAALKEAGYDVIVSLDSEDDRDSKTTCGNAILSERAHKSSGDGVDCGRLKSRDCVPESGDVVAEVLHEARLWMGGPGRSERRETVLQVTWWTHIPPGLQEGATGVSL